MTNLGLFGFLTVLALALALIFAAFASVFVKRLGDRAPIPISEEIGSAKAVMAKVRKREPMSKDELDYAKQIVADRSSLMAYPSPALCSCWAAFLYLAVFTTCMEPRPPSGHSLG